jgi:hypothetical protein
MSSNKKLGFHKQNNGKKNQWQPKGGPIVTKRQIDHDKEEEEGSSTHRL